MHRAPKAGVTNSAADKFSSVDKIGWIALLIGTGIIAWSGVLVRFLDVGPLAGGAWRMALAVPALAVWARLASGRRMSLSQPAAFAFLLFLAGLAFAADVGFYHIALTGTKVANASFIGNMAPILTVIGGALFFTEHPPPRVWFALALALFGSWVMAGMAAPLKLGFGDICALCASFAYASYLLVIKRVRAGLDGPTATLWSAAVSAVALAIAALTRGEILLPHSALGWTIVALLGIVSHAMGQGLTSVAIGRVPVGLVALVLLAQPPFSALLAWRVIGETMTPLQMTGGAVILAAVFLARPE
jgi:drug/metabolite transporter (DMT)-like permease